MFERIAVMGAGAIGGTIGAYLTKAGHDVTLIDQWGVNVDRVKEHGLHVTTLDGNFTVPANIVHLGDACNITDPFDLIFLAVKSYDTVWATHFVIPLLKPTGVIVSAQNGINDDRIAHIVGFNKTIGCVITLGVGMYEPGKPTRTSVTSRLAFYLGELSGLKTPRIQALAVLMNSIGPTKITTNLWGERWAKLAVNSMANPICALTGLTSGESRSTPGVVDITVKIGAEVVEVGTALGVNVEPINGVPADQYVRAARDVEALEDLKSQMAETARELGEGRPSMLQDVMKGRRTEIEFLDGFVAKRGREVGVPTPACDTITELIKRVETGELKSEVGNIKYMEQFM